MARAALKQEPESFALDRRLPAAEQVYRGLREAILTCRLEPNEAISENRLCGLFGVSRSPVRTAITRLAEDGLIDIFPQRGTFVAPIKLRQVREAADYVTSMPGGRGAVREVVELVLKNAGKWESAIRRYLA